MKTNIRKMVKSDWADVRAIYQQGIASGHATFETEASDWNSWDRDHLEECRLVGTSEDQVIGWAALSPVSGRCVYDGVAEVSVYVAQEYRGQGLGTALLQRLVELSERAGLWTLEAGIFPENVASLVVHEKSGFRTVGTRQRLGQLNGVWRDVQLLERRSPEIN